MSGSPLLTTLVQPYANSLRVKVHTSDPSTIPLPSRDKIKCEYATHSVFRYGWLPLSVVPDDQGVFTINDLTNCSTYVVRCNYQESDTSPMVYGTVSNYLMTLSTAEDIKVRYHEMTDELVALKEELRIAKETNDRLSLRSARHDVTMEVHAANQKIDELMARIRVILSENADLKSKIRTDNKLELEIAQLKSDKDRLMVDIAVLKQQVATGSTEHMDEIQRLKKQIDAMIEADVMNQDALITKTHTIQTLTGTIIGHEQTILDQQSQLHQAHQELDERICQIEKIDELNRIISSLSQEIDRSKQDIDKYELENGKLRDDINTLMIKRIQFEKRISDISGEIDVLKLEVDQYKLENGKLRGEINTLMTERIQLEEKIYDLSGGNYALTTERVQFEKRISELSEENYILKVDVDQYKSAEYKALLELDLLMIKHHTLEKTISDISGENDALKLEIDQYKLSNNKLTREIDTLTTECVRLQDQSQQSELQTTISEMTAQKEKDLKDFRHAFEKLHTQMCEVESLHRHVDKQLIQICETAKVKTVGDCIDLLRQLREELENAKMTPKTYFKDSRMLRTQMSELMTVFRVSSVQEAILKYQSILTQQTETDIKFLKMLGVTQADQTLYDELQKTASPEAIHDMTVASTEEACRLYVKFYKKIDTIMELMSDYGIAVPTQIKCLDYLEQVFMSGVSVCDSLATHCGFTSDQLSFTEYPKTIDTMCQETKKQKNKINKIMMLMGDHEIVISNQTHCLDYLEQVFISGVNACDSLMTHCGFTPDQLSFIEYPKTIDTVCQAIEQQKLIIDDYENKLIQIRGVLEISPDNDCVETLYHLKDLVHNSTDKIAELEEKLDHSEHITGILSRDVQQLIADNATLMTKNENGGNNCGECEHKKILDGLDITCLPLSSSMISFALNPVFHAKGIDFEEWISHNYEGEVNSHRMKKILDLGGWKPEELDVRTLMILKDCINTHYWERCGVFSKLLHYILLKC